MPQTHPQDTMEGTVCARRRATLRAIRESLERILPFVFPQFPYIPSITCSRNANIAFYASLLLLILSNTIDSDKSAPIDRIKEVHTPENHNSRTQSSKTRFYIATFD